MSASFRIYLSIYIYIFNPYNSKTKFNGLKVILATCPYYKGHLETSSKTKLTTLLARRDLLHTPDSRKITVRGRKKRRGGGKRSKLDSLQERFE